ncbi:hypothetical protein EDF38_1791 [Frigoribacterium sp. PhB160]|jgi:hypothetical protein|uniref:hypothetical protein n=1 Tax=Frigoribacterium sp. PhB160 TaxID=2485192 RepID=UPI000F466A0E|nr:hypothetical protein [Frigoribacterium sp. PhB160]ROS62678.1 hypothetical protein EDF38_1791 [Frigoribacterium sp. PhB160]
MDHGRDDATTPAAEAVDGLEARLRQVEAQPIASRAAAFAEVHDELRTVLEQTSDDVDAGGR